MATRVEIVQIPRPGLDHCEPKFNEQEELSKGLTWSGESVPRVR